jgi:CheY-like chemotaxis protein
MDRQILESRGYRVLTAAGGPEALEIFRQRAEDIALVLLDLTMPRMSGDEVFREMNLVRPGVPVLISSGFTEEQVMEKFTDAKLAGFLQKPYSLQVLLDRVEELVPKG